MNKNPEGGAFLSEESCKQLITPLGQWPDGRIPIGHGMGMLSVCDDRISRQRLYGHQGFAYGAVNGVFLTGEGDGFVSLNNGASEQRVGHISLLNQELIRLFSDIGN